MPAMAGGSGAAGMTGTRVRVVDAVLGSGDSRVEAFIVEPADGRVRAGILFLHWLGDHRSDRTQFLSEARSYAEAGVRCVLPAGRLPWEPDPVDAATDIANLELEQQRLGAALDRLGSGLSKGTPLALVGHDFGAMHGLVLAARRPVFNAAVLIAATPRWADWFLRFWKVDGDRFDYLRRLSPYDPVAVAHELGAKSLWQFSERDFFIAPMSAIELARASGPDPKIEWYAADHAMRSAKARGRRATFLRDTLGLS
jgi:pimeloyl-ACP methyl ester carboxylesterase